MVSISNTTGHGSSFSNHVDHDHPPLLSLSTSDNECALLVGHQPYTHLAMHSTKDLKKIFPATWFITIYLFTLIIFEVISFLLYDVFHVKILGGVDEPFALLTAIHVGMWAFTYLYDRYLHFQHHALRRHGYLNFFMQTKNLRRVPLGVFSLGNASLLLVVAFTGNHPNHGMLSLIRVFQVVASIEVFSCTISSIIYLVCVVSFNHASKLPDVYHQEATEGFNNHIFYDAPDIGFKDNGDLDDILEKQSEMIRYLKQHNTYLGKTIVELTDKIPNDKQKKIIASSNIST